jgi:hypothetical protein
LCSTEEVIVAIDCIWIVNWMHFSIDREVSRKPYWNHFYFVRLINLFKLKVIHPGERIAFLWGVLCEGPFHKGRFIGQIEGSSGADSAAWPRRPFVVFEDRDVIRRSWTAIPKLNVSQNLIDASNVLDRFYDLPASLCFKRTERQNCHPLPLCDWPVCKEALHRKQDCPVSLHERSSTNRSVKRIPHWN